MNDDRFDSLAKTLTASPTRRKALGLLAGSTGLGLVLAGLGLGGLADLLGVTETEAGKHKHKHKKKRKKKKRKRQRRVQQAAGTALFPDLQVLPPGDLRFDRPGVDRILRFTNTIWNAGQGRLELEGDVDPNREQVKKIFQNIYDAPIGGTRVGRQQINGTIIYHKEHGHFHFAEFASYVLLVSNGAGYVQLTPGTKTSFCITDNNPLNTGLPAQYTNCARRLQGLTPGWGDTYEWFLPDQWIVIGTDQLPDGEYALQSTVDPNGLLNEGGGPGEGNNTAITYFTVDRGEITNVRHSPEVPPQ